MLLEFDVFKNNCFFTTFLIFTFTLFKLNAYCEHAQEDCCHDTLYCI